MVSCFAGPGEADWKELGLLAWLVGRALGSEGELKEGGWAGSFFSFLLTFFFRETRTQGP